MENKTVEIVCAAAEMTKVPLLKLDALIKERNMYAVQSDYESVLKINELIKKLLAHETPTTTAHPPPEAKTTHQAGIDGAV